jgi:hypothetical protein
MQIVLNVRARGEERITIDVIQRVHYKQDDEREIFAADRGYWHS